MTKGLGAIVASGVVGTVVWAFTQAAKRQADTETAQGVVYVRQPNKDDTRKALIGGILQAALSFAERGVDRPPSSAPRSSGSVPAQPRPTAGRGVGSLLDLIGQHEAPKGYDQVYGGSKIAPPRPITQMTVGEVLEWQDRSVRAGSKSSAAGRYQIIRGTLRSLVRDGVVSMGSRFDKATQDRLATQLMNRRGLQSYLSGRMSETDFAQNLSKEWASLPVAIADKKGRPAAGQSYYAGDGLNRALTSLENVFGAIRGIG
ncbi:hypothetical protein [Phaeobacter inhibens]|uniref:hypothetical protein n=1 Tax=Phaeobacter inhibens TaxID=221822 RepID=UPI00076BBE7A|nr:hypothetical protein [Phaeobacter inhibens]KXF89950.1 hypothetical protein AT574_13945 [Phaeobacter inhibens]WHP70216.1 hypothetical protein QMZ01_08615 [Phaeobacter inhibens]